MRGGLLLLGLGGCTYEVNPDPFPCDLAVWYRDSDGDGFGLTAVPEEHCGPEEGWALESGDCHDGDPARHPGAPEEDCTDPVDYDCDGQTLWADADGDGFAACEDCDDHNSQVRPGATEYCNGVDDDCDGTIDEEDAVNTDSWFVDSDGDGFGDPEAVVESCEPPDGAVDNELDCDDTDANISPEAREVLNGIDDDCDGAVDLIYGVGADAWLSGAAAGDQAGATMLAGPDLDGDGLPDIVIGAPGADVGPVGDAGTISIWSGSFEGHRSLADASAVIEGGAGLDGFGTSFQPAGDVDGDGYEDLLLAAIDAHALEASAGRTWLLSGPLSGVLDTSQATTTWLGSLEGERSGARMVPLADIDGHGTPGIALGSVRADPTGKGAGRVYLLPSTPGTYATSEATTWWQGEDNYMLLGWDLAGDADWTGDGVADLVIGSPGSAFKSDWPGRVYLMAGPLTGAGGLDAAHAAFWGSAGQDYLGVSILAPGDLDGDGHEDLVLGAEGNDDNGTVAGAAYVLHGPFAGELVVDEAAVAIFYGGPGDYAGSSLATAGDLDGDGTSELLVGAIYQTADTDRHGAAYVLRGPHSGTTVLEELVETRGAVLRGDADFDLLGASVAAADLDGDGLNEVLVGAWLGDHGGQEDAGTVIRWVPRFP